MRVVAVIQARLGSTRLPGKVLMPLAGRSVLDWVVRAARTCTALDDVVVATSSGSTDDPLVAEARRLGVRLVRGSEDDVLARFVQVVDELDEQQAAPDALVRLTADCPLLDPEIIDAVVGAWRAAPSHDYVSTVVHRSLPRGLDVELITVGALRRVDAVAVAHDRAHVTSAVYADPLAYRVLGVSVAPGAADLRVTLDTAEDYQALVALTDLLGDAAPSWRQTVATLRARPDIIAVNAHVEQKPIQAG